MANFRGTVQGNRGQAARLGHSRLQVNCNSWTEGVQVNAVRDANGINSFHVFITGGSNGGEVTPVFVLKDGKLKFNESLINKLSTNSLFPCVSQEIKV